MNVLLVVVTPWQTTIAAKDETFATPESLKHYLVVVPSKLRLVTLAAFILWKSKVSKLRILDTMASYVLLVHDR